MAPPPRIAVIGAGIAGLACARALARAGLAPVVFDKGRGVGGRVATRRGPDGARFDHGAQYVTAHDTGFAALLDEMRRAGAAAEWADGTDGTGAHFVGVPQMRALAQHLAAGLDSRQGCPVTALHRDGAGWTVALDAQTHRFERVVVTVPAPQLAALLGDAHPLVQEVAAVRLAPCLTLMAAFTPDAPRPFIARAEPGDALAWIAQDSAKPGRAAPGCWVAQAGPDWSAAHLEADFDTIAALMLPLLHARLGSTPEQLRHAAAHRWRYARVTVPLGRPFVRDPSGTLHAGGDWCLGARVEAAWKSGDAIARDILAAP